MQNEVERGPLPKGMTRDCVDPWVYVEIAVNGAVSLCCVRAPIGNLETQTLAQILHGDAARSLRHDLLKGQPDETCRACRLRGMTRPRDLREKVGEILQTISTPAGFDPLDYAKVNPDVEKSGMDPTAHFLEWGRLEGRPIRP